MYIVTDLAPSAATGQSEALALNAGGMVVGQMDGSLAFVWTPNQANDPAGSEQTLSNADAVCFRPAISKYGPWDQLGWRYRRKLRDCRCEPDGRAADLPLSSGSYDRSWDVYPRSRKSGFVSG
jgi:hypothetical protein